MSHIPSSAMPHAGHIETPEEQEDGETVTLTERANGFADRVRSNPRPVIAAGAAILAGAVAAAAIPFIGRNWSGGDAKKSSAKKTTAKKSAAGKAGAVKADAKPKAASTKPKTKAASKSKAGGKAA